MALTRITKGVIKPNENYDTHDINSTGIITATGLNISGNASIGGVLTYEDVTNIDSVGLITARKGIISSGVVTATSFVGDGSNLTGLASDKIEEGNTKAEVIDTGSDGRFVVTTEGSERFSIDSSGDFAFESCNDSYFSATGTLTIDYKSSNTTRIRNFTKTGGFYWYPMNDNFPVVIGSQYDTQRISFYKTGEATIGTGLTLSGSTGNIIASGIITATNFAKADGSSLGGGLTAESNAPRNTHSNNAASALTSNSTNNTILGWNAGNNISTGDNNTIIGYRAGGVHNNSDETMIGANCFSEKSSHTKAVGLGYGAGSWNEGDNNTAIGYQSVGANGNSDGNNNTGLGFQALYDLKGGSNNVALGYQANNQHTTGSNCIVIGANADASAVDVDNEITLGDSNINHLRIPGIGVTFATSGNHISGITTFSDRIKLGNSGNGQLYYSGGIKMVSAAQIELESANQMYIHAQSSGLFLRASNQEVISVYGGSGGGVYFRHNGTQKLKLEGGNWTYQGSPTVTFDNHLYASSDSAIDIGTNSVRFRNIYADTLYGDGSNLTGISGGGSVTSDSEENTVGGSDAGLNLDSDTYRNTLFGYQAGEQINSGDDNTCIGWKAADKLTNGSKNVAVGSEALEYITGGSDNVAIGWEAGRSLTSGQGNTMIGNMAGRSMSGNENIAIGDHAYSNGGGTRTIGLGGESVWLGGTDVIGIGKYTMSRGNSQVGGIGIGYYAGRNNAGDHNVYIGYEAGKGTSSSPYSTGEYNVSLGYRSLYNITTGNENIALGAEAGDVLTTGSNNIIIGDGADASSASISNEITLGNSSITKFRIPGLNNFEISDAGVLSGTASAATSANGFRNVTVSTSSPSGGSDGDVWIKYS